jgi:hypothetical protein
MTAIPSITAFPRLRLPRLSQIELTEGDMSAVALIVAVPAALDATILWSMTQGSNVLHLALVYAITGHLTYLLVQALLARLQSRRRAA